MRSICASHLRRNLRCLPTRTAHPPTARLSLWYRHASSAFPDFVPESLKESVKTSLIEKITNRRIEGTTVNGQQSHHHHPQHAHTAAEGNINQSSLGLEDPLEDLLLEEPNQYWPRLPENVQAVDPFQLTKSDLDQLSHSIRQDLIGTDHPVLNKAAAYFFESSADGGKKVRPMMVMLLSRALAETVMDTQGPKPSAQTTTVLSQPHAFQRPDLPDAQRRLAEISEMIHTASLFHDDVIDGAETRRGVPAVHMAFGNKMAILAGDYLLARASICLARLRHVQVIETMSTIIEQIGRAHV